VALDLDTLASQSLQNFALAWNDSALGTTSAFSVEEISSVRRLPQYVMQRMKALASVRTAMAKKGALDDNLSEKNLRFIMDLTQGIEQKDDLFVKAVIDGKPIDKQTWKALLFRDKRLKEQGKVSSVMMTSVADRAALDVGDIEKVGLFPDGPQSGKVKQAAGVVKATADFPKVHNRPKEMSRVAAYIAPEDKRLTTEEFLGDDADAPPTKSSTTTTGTDDTTGSTDKPTGTDDSSTGSKKNAPDELEDLPTRGKARGMGGRSRRLLGAKGRGGFIDPDSFTAKAERFLTNDASTELREAAKIPRWLKYETSLPRSLASAKKGRAPLPGGFSEADFQREVSFMKQFYGPSAESKIVDEMIEKYGWDPKIKKELAERIAAVPTEVEVPKRVYPAPGYLADVSGGTKTRPAVEVALEKQGLTKAAKRSNALSKFVTKAPGKLGKVGMGALRLVDSPLALLVGMAATAAMGQIAQNMYGTPEQAVAEAEANPMSQYVKGRMAKLQEQRLIEQMARNPQMAQQYLQQMQQAAMQPQGVPGRVEHGG
jgi:hypothetical protein